MDTTVPWARKLNYQAATVADMLGVHKSYMTPLETKSGITRRQMGESPGKLFNVEDVFRLARYRRDSGTIPTFSKQIVIAVHLPKGGVGKTTSSAEITTCLALHGYSVLLVDLDGQGDLSEGLGYDPEITAEIAAVMNRTPGQVVEYTFGDLFDIPKMAAGVSQELVIKKPYGEAGPHLIPADDSIYEIEEILSIKPAREKQIANFLRDARNGKLANFNTRQYDFIILDCPPGVGTLSTNAIVAADLVVSPIALTRYAVKGISRFARRLEKLREEYDHAPDVVTLPTFFEPKVSRVSDNFSALKQYFAESTTESLIPKSELFAAALSANMPLSLDKPRSPGAVAYREATAEILTRLKLQFGKSAAIQLEGSDVL